MEYEIEDDALLFDDSTNPSLKHDEASESRGRPASPQRDVADRRKLQKAELIPDEEEGLQAA